MKISRFQKNFRYSQEFRCTAIPFFTGFKVCRYSYDENVVYCANIPGETNTAAFILPNADGAFTVGVNNAVQIIKWDGVSNQTTLISTQFYLDKDVPTSLASYARSTGSYFYGGTFSKKLCNNADYTQHNVYRYDNKNGLVKLIAGTITAGIVFDPKKNIMYHLASCRLIITAYDWNRDTGDICKEFFLKNFKFF